MTRDDVMNIENAAALYHGLKAQQEIAMPQIVRSVRQAADEGFTEAQLARLFGASRTTIRRWLDK